MLKKTGLPALLICCLITCFSCKKGDPESLENPPAETGLVCETGATSGTLTTQSIGPAGGTVKSDDNRLQLTIPAGAFASEQSIQIQPITNTNPGGVGEAYRILPHGVTFSKPVTLTFQYENEELAGSSYRALCIATQNEKGIWVAPAGAQTDTSAHTVSIQTTHFSDWSFMESFRLVPELAIVEPGASQDLEVQQFFAEDLLAPLTKDAEVIAPKSAGNYLKKWNLGGEGDLLPLGNKASYKAPAAIPARNPVAVSVNMEYQGKAFLLVSNIYIGRDGVNIRINNGAWLWGPAEMGVMKGPEFFLVQGTIFTNGTNFYGLATIQWPLSSYSGASYGWNYKTPGFLFSTPTASEQYNHFHVVPPGVQQLSPGEIRILRFGKIDEPVIGIFHMSRAGKVLPNNGGNPYVGVVPIEGFFKVRRSS